MTEHSGEERTSRERSTGSEGEDAGADTAAVFGDREAEREISHDDIRNRAHEIYLGRGGSEGDEVADWLEAEREVRNRSRGKGSHDSRPTDIDPRT